MWGKCEGMPRAAWSAWMCCARCGEEAAVTHPLALAALICLGHVILRCPGHVVLGRA